MALSDNKDQMNEINRKKNCPFR